MSFIVTPKGNYVPVSNVKVVKPLSAGGCVVSLKTGESFKDSRTPAELLSNLVDRDLTPVVTSIYAEIEALKVGVAHELTKLNSEIRGVTSNTNELNSGVTESARLVVKQVSKLDSATQQLATSQGKIRRVTKELEYAIEEAVQGS